MTAVYYALSGANGYFKIVYKKKNLLLIYTTPQSLTKIDFTGLNGFVAKSLEIDLKIINDFKLHISSNGKEGYKFLKVPLKDLGSFERFAE
jgi:uncharacterized membrane protein